MASEWPGFNQGEVPNTNSERFARQIEVLNQFRPTGDAQADMHTLLRLTGYEVNGVSTFPVKPEEGVPGTVRLAKQLLEGVTGARPNLEAGLQEKQRANPDDQQSPTVYREIPQAEERALRDFIAHYEAAA